MRSADGRACADGWLSCRCLASALDYRPRHSLARTSRPGRGHFRRWRSLGVLAIQVVTSLARGDVGLDLVALLSMGGALALSQPLGRRRHCPHVCRRPNAGSVRLPARRPRHDGSARSPATFRPSRRIGTSEGSPHRDTGSGRPHRRACGRRPTSRRPCRCRPRHPRSGNAHRRGVASYVRRECFRAEWHRQRSARPSRSWPSAELPRAPMWASSGWSKRHGLRRRRWRASPTATASPSLA